MTPTATWTFNENVIMTIITDREHNMSVKRRNLRKYPISPIYKDFQYMHEQFVSVRFINISKQNSVYIHVSYYNIQAPKIRHGK